MINKSTRITTGAFLLTGSKVLTLAISLVTSMLLSRFRSLTEYGTYSELMLVITLAVSIITFGIPNSINFFLPKAKNQGERDRFLSVYYSGTTFLSVLCGFILIILVPFFVYYFKNDNISVFSYVLAIIPWTKIILGGRSHMLIAVDRVKREIIYNILNSVSLLLIIVFTIVFKQGFSFYMMLYVIVESVFSIAVYFEANGLISKFGPLFDKALIVQILTFSIPLGVSTALGTLCTEIDKLMIGNLYTPEQVALYTNAGKELPFGYLAVSFTAIIIPKVVVLSRDREYEKAVDLWKKASEFCFVIMAFCSVACIVFAPQIIHILYSDKYLPAVGIFRIYSLAILSRITNFGLLLNANGKSGKVMINSIVALASNVVLNFVLYFSIGFMGPAIATFLSLIISIAFQLLLTSKEYGISFGKIMPWKRLIKILAINVLMGGIIGFIMQQLKVNLDARGLFLSLGLGVIWLGVYALIMISFMRRQLKEINSFS